jgi:hypothetical protein
VGENSFVELRLVASEAIGGRRIVVIVGVRLRAAYGGMLAGQRIVRIDGVIEFCIRPTGCRVTDSAVRGKPILAPRGLLVLMKSLAWHE